MGGPPDQPPFITFPNSPAREGGKRGVGGLQERERKGEVSLIKTFDGTGGKRRWGGGKKRKLGGTGISVHSPGGVGERGVGDMGLSTPP